MRPNLTLLTLSIVSAVWGIWWMLHEGGRTPSYTALALFIHAVWVRIEFFGGGATTYSLRRFIWDSELVPSGLRISLAPRAAQELRQHLLDDTKIVSVCLRQRGTTVAAGVGILLTHPNDGVALYIDEAGLMYYANGLDYVTLRGFLLKGNIEGLNVEVLLDGVPLSGRSPSRHSLKTFRYRMVVKNSVLALRRFGSFK